MAIYYTGRQKAEIVEWLLELRRIVNPDEYPAKRDRARELVGRLETFKFEPTSIIATEFERLRRIWRRLEAQAPKAGVPN
jgi:hypothetical protein